MASYARTIILGNLGREPEVTYTQKGTKKAQFSVATTRRWKDAAGAKQEETTWYRCIAWSNTADVVEKYLHKGDPVFIDGEIHTNEWTDKDGVKRYGWDLWVSALQLLGARREGGRDEREPGDYGKQQSVWGKQEPQQQETASTDKRTSDEPFEDDIPF